MQIATKTTSRRILGTDNHGATMVIGLFMAVFLVGILYYLVGIGDTIFFQQRMQDAADSAAYSSAVMHARGMNLIALINMIMAALMAVLMVLSLTQKISIATATFAAAQAWFNPPALGAIPPSGLTAVASKVAKTALQKKVDTFIRALHCCSKAVAVSFPIMSQARVVLQIPHFYNTPNDKLAFVWPLIETLPVSDDTTGKLCKKGAEYAGDLASAPFDAMRIPGLGISLGDFISPIIKGVTATALPFVAAEECGVEPGQPVPTLEHKDVLIYPKTGSTAEKDCDNMRKAIVNGEDSLPSNTGACEEDGKEKQKAQINAQLGHCNGNADCAHREMLARSQCNPFSPVEAGIDRYNYFVAKATVYFELNLRNGIYEKTDDIEWSGERPMQYGEFDKEDGNFKKAAKPCFNEQTVEQALDTKSSVPYPVYGINTKGMSELEKSVKLLSPKLSGEPVWDTWSTARGSSDELEESAKPVCVQRIALPDPVPEKQREKAEKRVSVEVLAVRSINACSWEMKTVEHPKLPKEEPDHPTTTRDKEGRKVNCMKKVPMKVDEDLQMGGPRFQLRSFVWDLSGLNTSEEGVKYASLFSPDPEDADASLMDAFRLLRMSGKISFAQAEYFFDEDAPIDDWLWNMKWTARLRRFRIPGTDDKETTKKASSKKSFAEGESNELSKATSELCQITGGDTKILGIGAQDACGIMLGGDQNGSSASDSEGFTDKINKVLLH